MRLYNHPEGRYSSVGIANRQGLDNPMIESR